MKCEETVEKIRQGSESFTFELGPYFPSKQTPSFTFARLKESGVHRLSIDSDVADRPPIEMSEWEESSEEEEKSRGENDY